MTIIISAVFILWCIGSTTVEANEIRQDQFGHIHTPQGTYKQDFLGNRRNESGDTWRRNHLGQPTNGERTIRRNHLGQGVTEGGGVIRKDFLGNRRVE